MKKPSLHNQSGLSIFLIPVYLLCGCSESPELKQAPRPPKAITVYDTELLSASPIGNEFEGNPWVAHIKTVDLDGDGMDDILVCEAQQSTVSWVRQTRPGVFSESILASDMNAPVHAETADLDQDGDLDILVSTMGEVFPNNDRIGSLIVLENDGKQHFTRRVLLENVARVTDARAGDFNGDGHLDIAVAQFGYDQGEIRWMERIGPWEYKSHSLLNLSGGINVCLADFDTNGTLDIVALMSQQWEEIHLFQNDGSGNFSSKIIYGSTNEEFNSSWIRLCDLNQDGLEDILYSNGDGYGPTTMPGPRPWHGVQWLENKGNNEFEYHHIGKLPGAYSPHGVDLDQDGAMDVVAVSSFNDWWQEKPTSMVWFKNDGNMDFTTHVLAYAPTHLLGLDQGNFDGSDTPSLVTGAFHAYPPYDKLSRLTMWHMQPAQ